MKGAAVALVVFGLTISSSASANDTLVRVEGGIGVVPVSSVVAASLQPDGTFERVNRNTVLGTAPGGQPWVIDRLDAKVGVNGEISVRGRGLLLAGGNGIGTNGNQMVKAKLFCGGVAHDSGLVPLEPDGDFRIRGVLTPVPPNPCANPVLLIVNAGNAWFAAGILKD
jgi:hypothetical protein